MFVDNIFCNVLIWFAIVFGGIIFICLIIQVFGFFNLGFRVRDNYVFVNKYERKIYFEKKKIEKIQEKSTNKIINCEDNIKYYKSKSRYEENVKLLHDKNLDNVVFVSEDYFKYLQACEKKNKKKGSK